ncbi:hypothetical protein [Sphingobacterium lactis]|uniref:Uncharacterized protein n=1 Tax=Sphingobacterium lactis TaxID=797291 RepID=A0A1H6BQP8_9SPHI|nr:hypothetical protein [Sphingobacterium lactis]SEG62747.1 hypothetical protein SAMN05421877_11150 [Sphingobacterium lactis]
MPYQRVSLKKKSGAPKPVNSQIILIPYDDIATFPTRGIEDVLVTGDITMKAAATAIGLYATSSSISRPDNLEGETDEEGFIQTLTFTHPGNYLEIEEFKQKWIGQPFIAITDECGDGKGKMVHGWQCNPLYFGLENQRNNEANKSTFNFAQKIRGQFVAGFYQGANPALAPDTTGSASGGI